MGQFRLFSGGTRKIWKVGRNSIANLGGLCLELGRERECFRDFRKEGAGGRRGEGLLKLWEQPNRGVRMGFEMNEKNRIH